jgi:hypothetical protein
MELTLETAEMLITRLTDAEAAAARAETAAAAALHAERLRAQREATAVLFRQPVDDGDPETSVLFEEPVVRESVVAPRAARVTAVPALLRAVDPAPWARIGTLHNYNGGALYGRLPQTTLAVVLFDIPDLALPGE